MREISCIGVIPARYPSTRLPGKPLADIAGKTLIQRVWEQASRARAIDHVLIATDDRRIADAAASFGAEALMTSPNHPSGSDRIAEVVEELRRGGREPQLVVNIQGDMPFINPQLIDQAVNAIKDGPAEAGMSTLAIPILDEEEFCRGAAVKVVLDDRGYAMYFSRAPIPVWRNRDGAPVSEDNPLGLKHMGLYVYRTPVLREVTALPQSFTEKREALEQLRALSHGVRIRVITAPRRMLEPSIEIDTPEDLERARNFCRDNPGY